MISNLAHNHSQSLVKLDLNATLADLPLCEISIDIARLTKEVVKLFENDAMIPGVILKRDGKFYGMLSRRRFLKRMSRPYALEIFLNRPLSTFDQIESFTASIFPDSTIILEASQAALERENGQMYEPIAVAKADGDYGLIDMPILLQAQSQIHQLTHQLLKEQTYAHMVQTEKMASLGRMLAGIAHEIRNPVNCIHGNMQFLQDYFGDLLSLVEVYQSEVGQPSPAIAKLLQEVELDFLQEDLSKILQSVELSAVRMTEIVTSLGNFSRIDETKKQLINLSGWINSTLLILESFKEVML
jgi:signal transduction histidine kinase